MTGTSSHRSPQHLRSETKETSVLVVALDAPILAAFSNAEVLVLAPALNSWLRHWVSDEGAARSRAQERVVAWLDRLERSGVHARGRVGDADPLQAIEDALLTFPADEIVIAGQSERSTRLADELVARARRRFELPVVRAEQPTPQPLRSSVASGREWTRVIGVSSTKNVNHYERKIMKNGIRSKGFRGRRAVIAAVVASVIAGAAGLMAGQGSAAPPGHSGYGGGYPSNVAKFKTPKLKDGVLEVRGTKASDKITLRLQADDPNILQVDVGDDGSADFSFARSSITKIAVRARAGDDLVRIDESKGAFTDSIRTTIDGGDGNDTIAGGKGVETLSGGRGNDSIDGNGGNDLALLGAGNDTFIWDPGDGSDTVEGQAGADTMRFNGASGTDQVELSANGHRLKFFRVQGTITMDTAGVERVDFNALGGADLATVNDLSGTDVRSVNVDLAGAFGGATADGAADRVVVNATNGNDAIDVSGDSTTVKVSGLAATTRILHSEVAKDRLDVNTFAGADTVGSAGLVAGAIQFFLDGLLVS